MLTLASYDLCIQKMPIASEWRGWRPAPGFLGNLISERGGHQQDPQPVLARQAAPWKAGLVGFAQVKSTARAMDAPIGTYVGIFFLFTLGSGLVPMLLVFFNKMKNTSDSS